MITQNYFKKHLKIFDCAKSLLPHEGFLSLQCLGSSLQWLLCEAQALAAWASVAVARGLSNCCSRTLERALSSSFQACGIFWTTDWEPASVGSIPCIGRHILILCTTREVHNHLLLSS